MTINIVCYAGGTCGDILTSLIDPKGAVLNTSGSISLPADRSKLKKPHLLPEIQDKLDYINHADLLVLLLINLTQPSGQQHASNSYTDRMCGKKCKHAVVLPLQMTMQK